MSNKTITITLSTGEARRVVNGLHILLIVLRGTEYFPELKYAQEIISEWLIAKYKGKKKKAREVIEALWWLNHALLEEIDNAGEPLLSNGEIPGKDALEMIRQKGLKGDKR